MKNSAFKSFISYYKWHLIFILIILVCLIFMIQSCSSDTTPDLTIGYIATPFVNEDDFNNKKTQVEHLLQDANGDDKKSAVLIPYTIDKQDDINELFVEMIDSKGYHIYILPKEAFEAYKDKNAFAKFNQEYANVEVLRDENNKIYAYSVEDNSFLENLGFTTTTNPFIAAADFGNDELSVEEKNGINITSHIIKSRKE